MDKDRDRIRLLQYENLRKNFQELVDHVLGCGYYNLGADVYTCDKITCDDIKRAFDELEFLTRRRVPLFRRILMWFGRC